MKGFFCGVVRMILAGACCGLLATGCQFMGTKGAIQWIEKGGNKNGGSAGQEYLIARDCQLLDEVVGTYGDDEGFMTIVMTDGYLRSAARDDLEGKAVVLGANTIQITDNREYKKQLETRLGLFKVEIYANAYSCKG